MPGYLVVMAPVDVLPAGCLQSACVSALHNNESRWFVGINHGEGH